MAAVTDRLIRNTDQPARHPWPADMHLQGGANGVVFCANPRDDYRTAFVEASPNGTFLRGEGATVAEAEDDCWAKFQTMQACPAVPGHGPFEARGYTNGAGFCTRCGGWFSKVLPVTDPPLDPAHKGLLERAFNGDEDALAEVLERHRQRREQRRAASDSKGAERD